MGYYKNLATEAAEDARFAAFIGGFMGTNIRPAVTQAHECSACGNLGYTIEKTEEGEAMVGCEDCRIRALEADAAVQLSTRHLW